MTNEFVSKSGSADVHVEPLSDADAGHDEEDGGARHKTQLWQVDSYSQLPESRVIARETNEIAENSFPPSKRQAELAKALRNSEAQFRALIEANADGVIVLRPNGVICYANPAAVHLLGRSLDELIGEMFGVPVVPGEVTEVNLHKPGSGSMCISEMRVTSIQWDGKPACLATLRDVTVRHNAEAEARKAVKRRDHFLALLGHELRNPLSAVGTAATLLKRQVPKGKLSEATGVIARQVAQMSKLLDDLLDVARVNEDKIRLRRCTIDLCKVVDNTIEAVMPQVIQRKHVLNLHLPQQPVYVYGDPTRLQQIFANLLSNAAKYTPVSGNIDVSLTVHDDVCRVIVVDNGVGLSDGELESIFEMFVQSDDTIDHSAGGLGLGLTLARDLVALHDGVITAESDGRNAGCEFLVELPIVEAPEIAPEEPASEATRKQVLLVEDIADSRKMLKKLLEFDGFEVTTACDGAEALEAIRQSPPDIALMDIGLPELSGYEVAQAVREEDELSEVVLIALTGYGQTSDRQKTAEAGFDAHMVKPFDSFEFQRILQEV